MAKPESMATMTLSPLFNLLDVKIFNLPMQRQSNQMAILAMIMDGVS